MGATISERKVHTIELLAQLEDENLLTLGLSDLETGNVESLDSFNARMNAKYP